MFEFSRKKLNNKMKMKYLKLFSFFPLSFHNLACRKLKKKNIIFKRLQLTHYLVII